MSPSPRAAAVVLAFVVGLVSPAGAARALDLRVDAGREIVEARVTGEPMREPLFLQDLDRQRRVPALDVVVDGTTLVARFDLRTLAPDGASRQLALQWNDTELARGAVVLPAADGPSALRWLVIVGPLLGLLMIAAAVWIGRRVVIGRRRER